MRLQKDKKVSVILYRYGICPERNQDIEYQSPPSLLVMEYRKGPLCRPFLASRKMRLCHTAANQVHDVLR